MTAGTRLDERQLAVTVSDSINLLGFNPAKFVEEFSHEHRTLQQIFTSLCLRWVYEMAAKYDSGDYDGRNSFSAEQCKKITELLGPCGWAMPLI